MASTEILGTTCLTSLLINLTMSLHPETFVFITVPPSKVPAPTLDFQMSFREAEGLTIIATLTSAVAHDLDFIFPCRMITLNVHSSLETVGFIAVIAQRLKELEIGINPVSGFFHDHIFVPLGREEEVIDVLNDLSAEAKKTLEQRN